MKELLDRLKAPMNRFWKRVLAFLIVVSGILTMLSEFVQPIMHDELIPEEIKPYLRMVYVAGYFGSFLALLTKKDANDAA